MVQTAGPLEWWTDLEDLLPTAELAPLRKGRKPGRSSLPSILPGLGFVSLGVAAAFGVHYAIPSLSPLVAGVIFGALAANLQLVPPGARRGTHFAAKRLLRIGVALLGLQLSASEVWGLGAPALGVVVATVAATFFGTRWLGRRLGLSESLSLLVATGFAICGASAIAAVEGVAEADEEEVAFSIGLVTLCGSLAIVILPLLRHPLALDTAKSFGSWVGASVHDVGQVVATASSGGKGAIRAAVVVKLTRVVLLAPLVAGLGLRRRSAQRATAVDADSSGSASAPTASTEPTPLVPLFVVGFVAAIVLRSTGWVPTAWLSAAQVVQNVLLCAALVGLGTGVRVAKLRRLGGRPLLLGLVSWILVAGVSFGGLRLIGQ